MNTEPPVLPCLQQLGRDTIPLNSTNHIIDGWDCWFYNADEQHSPLNENRQTISQLWVGFLRYYTEQFDWEKHVVCIRKSQAPLTRIEKAWHKHRLTIEDPFELSHNLAASATHKCAMEILNCFAKARLVFGKPENYFKYDENSNPIDLINYLFNKDLFVIVVNKTEKKEDEKEKSQQVQEGGKNDLVEPVKAKKPRRKRKPKKRISDDCSQVAEANENNSGSNDKQQDLVNNSSSQPKSTPKQSAPKVKMISTLVKPKQLLINLDENENIEVLVDEDLSNATETTVVSRDVTQPVFYSGMNYELPTQTSSGGSLLLDSTKHQQAVDVNENYEQLAYILNTEKSNSLSPPQVYQNNIDLVSRKNRYIYKL